MNESRLENNKELNEARRAIADCEIKLEARDWRIAMLENEVQLLSTKQSELETSFQRLKNDECMVMGSKIAAKQKTFEFEANYDQMYTKQCILKKEYQEKNVIVTELEAQLENSEKQKEALWKELYNAKEALRQSKHDFFELQKNYFRHLVNHEVFFQEVRLYLLC